MSFYYDFLSIFKKYKDSIPGWKIILIITIVFYIINIVSIFYLNLDKLVLYPKTFISLFINNTFQIISIFFVLPWMVSNVIAFIVNLFSSFKKNIFYKVFGYSYLVLWILAMISMIIINVMFYSKMVR